MLLAQLFFTGTNCQACNDYFVKNTSFNHEHTEYLVFPHFQKEHCTANYHVPQFFKNTDGEYVHVLTQATVLEENHKAYEVGWSPDHPGLVECVSAHGRGIGTR